MAVSFVMNEKGDVIQQLSMFEEDSQIFVPPLLQGLQPMDHRDKPRDDDIEKHLCRA